MTPLDAALAIAAHGLRCFPCREENKAPTCLSGFKAATRDPFGVRDLWRRWPGDLVGVPTGAVNRFDVLDIDPRHGGTDWLAENRHRLPVTRCHTTRGGGLHILFQHRDGVRNTAGKIAPGVDTRGDGGYIVWWPATGFPVHDAHHLAACPNWLLSILLTSPAPLPDERRSPIEPSAAIPRIAAAIAATLVRLELACPGQRHERLRAAAVTLGGLMDVAGFSTGEAEQRLLDAVRRAGGADVVEANARATIRWGLERGRRSPLELRGRR